MHLSPSRFQPAACLALGLLAAGVPAAPQAPTGGGATYTNSTPAAIPDLSTVNSTITVSGALPSLLDLNLRTFITHTFAGDLDITLTSPAGTVVTVTTDNGADNNNVFNGTDWDNDGATPVTDAVFANGVVETPLAPEESFAGFLGEDPNGTWTLTITDDAGADVGALNSWSLSIGTLETAPGTIATTIDELTPVPVPDAGSATLTLDIIGAERFLYDLQLTTFITHTRNSDLDITLTSPSGTVVTVTTDNGGNNDNVFNGTVWRDDGATPVTDFAYVNNVLATPLVPEEPFAAFLGEDPNGTWTLSVADDQGADSGTLQSWQLVVNSTLQNLEQGVEGRIYATKGTFTIDWAKHNLGVDADRLSLRGVANPAGIVADLAGATLSVGLNGNAVLPTEALSSSGSGASPSGSTPTVKAKLSPKKGAFSAASTGLDLSTILGLTNTTGSGTVTLDAEVSLVGTGLSIAKVRGDLEFVYSTVEDKATKGTFSFKKDRSLSGIFQSLKSRAVEQPGGGHLVSVSGPLVDVGGTEIVPTGDVSLTIGGATPITIPLASFIATGFGATSVYTVTPGSVAGLKSFSISNAKRAFSFATTEVAGTGIPTASVGSPLAHEVTILLSVPTSGGPVNLSTFVELVRKSDTSGSWKR
jgi:subtilisin-like proprotein convertase family protein